MERYLLLRMPTDVLHPAPLQEALAGYETSQVFVPWSEPWNHVIGDKYILVDNKQTQIAWARTGSSFTREEFAAFPFTPLRKGTPPPVLKDLLPTFARLGAFMVKADKIGEFQLLSTLLVEYGVTF